MDRLANLAALGNAAREGGALLFANETTFSLPGQVSDEAMRMLFTPGPRNPSHETRLELRKSDAGSCLLYTWGPPADHSTMQVAVKEKGKPTQASIGGLIPHPDAQTFAPGKPVELEARVVGGKLTIKLNGAPLAERDITLVTPGEFAGLIGAGTRVHALQTLDLSKPPATPSAK